MILIGELSLWVALLMAAWSSTVSYAGGRLQRSALVTSGERALHATTAFVLLASAGLWTAILRSDFSFTYVESVTSANLPTIYKITAFWGGQAGTMLFWCLLLALCSSICVATYRGRNRAIMPFVTGTLAATLAFFLATTAFGAYPYERLDWTPIEGRGLNPQLQTPWMAIHPPSLYLGYVATSVPFAFAIAALITRRIDAEWLATVRRWSLVSWFFLTVGITLGMRWAYVELGWGGYWAWDPAENASLLPWLTGTAFLHSIVIQEKRGMMRKWNVVLVVSTFLLAILGTSITRSGMISSVHSLAQSVVGTWALGFLVVAVAATAWLVKSRLPDVGATATLESMVSREAAFLYNNVVLVGIAFSVLWGTLFPVLTEWVRGVTVTVGPEFFNAVNVPLGLLLLGLTGVGPLIAWRRASVSNLRRQVAVPVALGVAVGAMLAALGMRDAYALVAYVLAGFVTGTILQEFYQGAGARRRMYGEGRSLALVRLVARNRRRYGGYIVHAGLAMMFSAFAGLAFKREHDITLKPGETFMTHDPYGHRWSFTSQGVSRFDRLNRIVTALALQATRDGVPVGVISSEKRQHVDSRGNPTFPPTTEVGIRSSARQDVYVVLAAVIGDETAAVRIAFNPLVAWVWAGGFVMALGGLIVMWPQSDRRLPHGGDVAAPELVTAAGGA